MVPTLAHESPVLPDTTAATVATKVGRRRLCLSIPTWRLGLPAFGLNQAIGNRARERVRSCPREWCSSGAAVMIFGGAGSATINLPAGAG
jgi:hypothetical protein